MCHHNNNKRLILFCLCCALTSNCGATDLLGLKLLPHNRVTRVSSVKLSVSQVTTYAVVGPVDVSTLADYPFDWLPDGHWHVRLWNDRGTDRELGDLVQWLREQRDRWRWCDKHPGEVRRINEIIAELSSWQQSGATHQSRISYSYSSTRKPGIAGFDTYDWLYFYYLNLEGTAITEISNAFR